MKKRLAKIARDLNSGISLVVEFLKANGYDCEEDPNETVSEEVAEIIYNNFQSFIAEKERKNNQKKNISSNKKVNTTPSNFDIPLEIKIIEAADREKKLIERIIGFTDFNWEFEVAKYHGTCSQAVDFSLFDEVICDLLLIESMSASKMGSILGFDIDKDPAEKEILNKAIKDLKNDKMLDGDESIYWLTDIGKKYAKNGVKFSTFSKTFELYFDLTSGLIDNVKDIFSNLKSEKHESQLIKIPKKFDEIKKLAEVQAPEIHFPKNNYLLQSADYISSDSFKAKLWVVLLENFRDNSLRTLVFDEKQNIILNSLSEALNQNESIKIQLFEKLIKVDEEIELTNEDKKTEQLEIEQILIYKQEEIEVAIDKHDADKIKEIEKTIVSIKRHFNSIEFEIELKRLFDETVGDLWIISPWIRNAAFKRIPFIENYLKKGGRVFIAYSEPEGEGQIMALEEPLNKLLDLEKRYQNFYIHQLPAFHYKNVWLRFEDGKDLYYSGSFNILSFFISQKEQKIRQEKMTRMDWDSEIEHEFHEVFKKFGLKYVNKTIDEFNEICLNKPDVVDRAFLQKLKTIDYLKLKPFINKNIENFDNALNELEETKQENINYYRKIFFDTEFEKYKLNIEKLSKEVISLDKKATIQKEVEKFKEEFQDIIDYENGFFEVLIKSINDLKTFNINNNNFNKNKIKRR